jgi:hypothetical protein
VETLVENLRTLPIHLPVGFDENGNPQLETFTPEELGIYDPVLINLQKVRKVKVRNPNVDMPSSGGMGGMMGPGAGMMPGMGAGAGAELDDGTGYEEGYSGGMGPGMGGMGRPGRKSDEPEEPREIELLRQDFTLQFAWKETKPTERLKNKEEEGTGQTAESAETPAQ